MRACYNYGTAGYISGISVQVNTNGILPGYDSVDSRVSHFDLSYVQESY
ncbi:hypothetical protein [Leptospira sp. mild_001]|nr:hypothetical protein [Leptospira sp. mild_001]